MQSVIMTNEEMEREYGISDYSFINASPAEGADEDKAAKSILNVINDTPKAVLHDYTDEIEIQKKYLDKKQRVLTGVSIMLLVISLFHIMNSMNYTIMSRKKEYGIMRAIGITDRDYYAETIYGLLYGTCGKVFTFYSNYFTSYTNRYNASQHSCSSYCGIHSGKKDNRRECI